MNKTSVFLLLSAFFLLVSGCGSMQDAKKAVPEAGKAAQQIKATLSVAKVISDNMVLQRDMKVPVWGKAAPGAEVTVKFDGQTAKAVAGKCGKWIAYLEPMQASSKNRTMTVSCGKETISIKNILVGEVWLCSGQSNMEMPMWTDRPRWRAADGDKFVKKANYPQIRIVITRPYGVSATPDDSFDVKWQAMSPENTSRFSATAFFFGTKLHKEINVPVGLITSHWGGTRIEPWTPPCGFETIPELKDISDKVNAKVPGHQVYKRYAADTQKAYTAWLADFAKAQENGKILPMPPAFPTELDTSITDRRTPSAIYNKMIVPYLPYAIRGAIWYQGCSNLKDGMLYAKKMQALLNGWRKVFNNPDMRFYFVQLAPYTYGWSKTGLAQIWEAQQAFEDANDQKVGMAVINDVGDFKDIHPRDKKTVGYRLADLALSRDYGKKDVNALYPRLAGHKIENGKFILSFKNVSKWKTAKGFANIDTFQVSDATGNYKKAKVAAKGTDLIVWSDEVKNPLNLRYMWLNVCAGKLFNENGLPLGGFRIEKPVSEQDVIKAFAASGKLQVEAYDVLKRKRIMDKRASVKKPFTAITYLVVAENKNGAKQWLAATMDAYTSDAKLTGVPLKDTKIKFQKYVNNISILGNIPQFAGITIKTGNIEFWPYTYSNGNAAKIPNASSQTLDFGDEAGNKGVYGSMQLHDFQSKTTIFALNNFHGRNPDFGFGNCTSGKNPDWTFAANAKDYNKIIIYTFLSGFSVDTDEAKAIETVKKAGNRLVEIYDAKRAKQVFDNRKNDKKTFSRITYLVTSRNKNGKFQWLAISMDAYTKDAKLTGVPTLASKIKFQQYVDNVKIIGNVAPFAGKSIKRGNIEFWPYNYSGANEKKIPNADSTYDFGDVCIANGGYGSMQIHDYAARKTIFALNNLHSSNPDFGFGNCPAGKNPDWTFAKTGKFYKSIKIYTFLSNN